MRIRRRTKIVHETERSFSFAVSRKPARFFCDSCGESVEMLSINDAAKLAAKAWREIVRAIEGGEIHSLETANGAIYVCAESISKTI